MSNGQNQNLIKFLVRLNGGSDRNYETALQAKAIAEDIAEFLEGGDPGLDEWLIDTVMNISRWPEWLPNHWWDDTMSGEALLSIVRSKNLHYQLLVAYQSDYPSEPDSD